MIATFYAAHQLGQVAYGEFAIIQSSVTMVASLAGIGLSTTTCKYVAELRQHDLTRAGRILGLSVAGAAISGAAGAITLFCFAGPLAANALNNEGIHAQLATTSIALFFVVLAGAQTGILTGLEEFRVNTYSASIASTVRATLIGLGTWIAGLNGCVIGFTVGYAATWAIQQFAVTRALRNANITISFRNCLSEFSTMTQFGIPATAINILVVVANWTFNILVVNSPIGFAGLGTLNLAMQLRNQIAFIPATINSVLTPVLANVSPNNRKASLQIVKHTTMANLALTSIATAAVLSILPYITQLLPNDYIEISPLTATLGLSAIITSMASPIGALMIARTNMWYGLCCCLAQSLTLLGIAAYAIQHNHGLLTLAAAHIAAATINLTLHCLYFILQHKAAAT